MPPPEVNLARPMTRFLLSFIILLGSICGANAQFSLGGKISSTANLIPEVSSIAPGATFSVALQLKHPEDWHSYYKNSGGVELPPSITWTLPEGFSAGPVQWPVPEVKDGFSGKSYVYQGEPVFVVDDVMARAAALRDLLRPFV